MPVKGRASGGLQAIPGNGFALLEDLAHTDQSGVFEPFEVRAEVAIGLVEKISQL